MADRYWVGGTGTWNSTTTTKWSAASGISFTGSRTGTALTTTGNPALVAGMTIFTNAGTASGTIISGSGNSWVTSASGTITSQAMSAATIGASVPTASDNVFFDANSNGGTTAFTITMATSPRVCNNLTITTDGTMTLAGTNIDLTVSGSLLFPLTNFNRTYSGTTTFAATTTGKTITTNGKTLTGGVTFNGSGGGWTLGSALDCGSGTISHLYGTFDTGGYAVTAESLLSTSSTTRTLNLNDSTITLSATSSALGLSGANLTFNAGTSSINLTNATTFSNSYPVTFYDLTIYSATAVSFNGAHTFNQLSITANNTNTTFSSSNTINILRSINSSSNISNFIFNANQTINKFQFGTTVGSCSRIMLRSNSIGTQRSIAMTTGSSINEVDFRDIAITGTTLSGSRLGDCKGNSGITFPAAKTVYFAATGSAPWGDVNSWSATSGGVADPEYFPLAQDTAVFPATTYPASGSVVSINAAYNIGTIDMSARTSNTMTLTINAGPTVYGDWTNGTGISFSFTGATTTFVGRQTQTLTSAGINFKSPINLYNVNNIVRLVGNNGSLSSTTLSGCTLDLNGYTWTSSTEFVTGGTSNLTFNGGALQFGTNFYGNTGFTTTQGSSAGKIVAGGSTSVFLGGSLTYNCTLEISSSTNITIYGSNTFTNITNTVTPVSIYFEYNTTNTFLNWNVNGTVGNLVTLDSSNGSASFSLSKASGVVSSDYLYIQNSTATGGATWYAGANSTNAGGNTGWIFTAPPSATATGNFLVFF
jgi:hypothetical protein